MKSSLFVVLVVAALSCVSSGASAASPPVCNKVVNACQKGGFIIGKKNKHPGVGLWAGCVRPLSKGRAVPGVTGVSKRDAVVCLQARKAIRTPRG